MDINEIKDQILIRSYQGNFQSGADSSFNLHELAKSLNISVDSIFSAFEELVSDRLIEEYSSGGFAAPTTKGLIHCENNHLIDISLIKRQESIRSQLIVTLNEIVNKNNGENYIHWPEWIEKAGISNQDFSNNEKILLDWNWITEFSREEYSITSLGKKRAEEIKKHEKRLHAFEDLLNLKSVTKQARGHRLEDLLSEIAEDEGWHVERRVKTQGEEIDIIINDGPAYYLCSCKWEKNAIQPKEIDLLESRINARASTKGIIFSMSGFTPNCFDRFREKMSLAIIVPFGPKEINQIFKGNIQLTDLLELKIDKIIKYKQVLFEDELK